MSAREFLPLLLALSAFAPCAAAQAQTESDMSSLHVVKVAPDQPLSALVPFAIESPGAAAKSLEFREPDAMTRNDQDLAADAEATIQEKAGFQNLEFNQGTWTYKQIVCPALPNHLFLRFSRDDGTRSMSMFSAAVPRSGEGKIRIIPIVRRGYSLFSPAPINALTIAAFNHIRAEEHFNTPPDWIGTGLCYAALAGATPQVANPTTLAEQEKLISLAMAPTLLVDEDGPIIRFADVAATPHPMEWSMIFNRKGQLLKANHVAASLVVVKPGPEVVAPPANTPADSPSPPPPGP